MLSMGLAIRFTASLCLGLTVLGCSDDSVPGNVDTPGASAVGFGPTPTPAGQPVAPCSAPVNPEALAAGPGDGVHFKEVSPVRRDISEGLPGAGLKLVIHVQNAAICAGMGAVQVDVWHADAGGQYSEPEALDAGTSAGTSLRGTQFTDDAGLVVFETIFPGWTRGRAPLIHVKVHHNGSAPVIGQEVYFDEETARAVYAEEPYAARGEPDTTAGTDPWQSQLGSLETPGPVAVTTQDGAQLVAKATLFVQPGAAQQL